MIDYRYTITTELGIHARPAVFLAKQANDFACEIWIGKEGQMVNAKDVMEIMSLMMIQGDELFLLFEGSDEVLAAKAMIALIHTCL